MRIFTPETRGEFEAWLAAAPRPLVAELTFGQLVVDATWTVTLREHGAQFADSCTSTLDGRVLLWTRQCIVTELIRLTKVPSWEWVRSATTAWRVKHSVKGAEMPADVRGALVHVLADQGAARFALDSTRLEAILAASTARGIRVDVAELASTRVRMSETHRQLVELLGFDPLPEENADQTLTWLAELGVTVPGTSSEDWAAREVAALPLARAAVQAHEQALWLKRRFPKLRELDRATKRGKVHSTMTPFAQVSGRVSSTRPALNNVAKDQRHLLMARPGHVLVTADFDGIEPRVLAGLSGDEQLAHDLATGDPYLDAAVRAGFEATKENRTEFKIAMLASMYGAAAGRTARQLGVTLERAKAIRADLWRPYLKAAAWLKAQTGMEPMNLDSGRPLGVVEAAHARPNLIIQSTAFDLFQTAVLRVHDALPKGAHVWMPIHDELVIETPERHVDRVVAALAEHMPTECRGVPIQATPVVLGIHWKKV